MDDIASIITPAGVAAIAALRISGPNSHKIITKITNLKEKDLVAGTFKLSWIKDAETYIDQALILCFKAPKSFTGEDVIEIHCHGGTWLSKKILGLVLDNGARLAKAGEFTERAILNKKIDLSQAEGILDLIHSRGELSSQNAVKLYSGKLGKKVSEIREELISILAELIACIDFPDEVAEYEAELFSSRIEAIIQLIKDILASEKSGLILREGFKIALAGAPNAGKSSLLNAILGTERAIVTEIAGTTRDIIEESFNINGLSVVFLDTAGIRSSSDRVEQMGIELSKKALLDADLILWLEDTSTSSENTSSAELIKQTLEEIGKNADANFSKRLVKIGTKTDLLKSNLAANSSYELCISVKDEHSLNELKKLIFLKANPELKDIKDHNKVSINTRQADALRQAVNELEKAIITSKSGLAHDFWTIDLKSAISKLGEITGDDLNEEVLDNMFSKFCIGK